MTIKAGIREQVRRRAKFACEFCGITETDAGGLLTIDHFQPKAKGGTDSLNNLLYCCIRCNQYKLDYWPSSSGDQLLWNPRHESASLHFLELNDGTFHPLTATGTFTISRLRLNRPPLVAHRLLKLQVAEQFRLLSRYRELITLVEQVLKQQSNLVEEQKNLLEEQRELLHLLLAAKETESELEREGKEERSTITIVAGSSVVDLLKDEYDALDALESTSGFSIEEQIIRALDEYLKKHGF